MFTPGLQLAHYVIQERIAEAENERLIRKSNETANDPRRKWFSRWRIWAGALLTESRYRWVKSTGSNISQGSESCTACIGTT